MIVAIIILLIGFIGSIFFNILLFSSKNSYVSQIKKIQEYNKELRSENEELGKLVRQKENQIKTYEETLRRVEYQKMESDSPRIEQLIKKNDDLRKQIAIVEKENERLILRVAELEKTVSVPSDSDDRVRQLEAKIEEQKTKISSLVGQIDKKEEEKKNINQRCKDAEKKIVEMQSTFEQLRNQNAGYQTQLISAQNQNADLSANINSLLDSKAELEKKNNRLLEQIQSIGNPNEILLNQLSQIKRENKELQSNSSNYRIQIVQKEERISELEKIIKELTDNSRIPDAQGIPDDLSSTDVSDEPEFPIDSDVIQFKDGEYNDTLKKISDVSVMTEYLKKSSHEKAQRYLKQVNEYAKELEELEDAIACLDEGEDEMSSECIRRFSKVFNENMAESVIEPVFKAKDEEKFYSEFLKLIVEYSSKCGVYTKNVTAGSKYENINYMEVITEDTTDPAKHKIISRILRLPFYAKYTSETGKVREKLLSKGSCVVLKAK